MSDPPSTIVVLAKEPIAGKVKTRLQAAFTPVESAALAAAALTDTLRVVRCTPGVRRVLAWEGDPQRWSSGFEVVEQSSGSLNDRLAAAFSLARADAGGSPILLIGMDTPQVTTELLMTRWGDADAVLGLSEDGGFWAIGLRDGDPGEVFAGVQMSTSRTGSDQFARLLDLGLDVRLLPRLRDVDTPADADFVAGRFPQLEFACCYRHLMHGALPRT